jgi:hypothetical protein
MRTISGCSVRTLVVAAVGLGAAIAPGAAWALPTVNVRVATMSPVPNAAHTSSWAIAQCASGRMVGGGSYLRNASNPATVPNNGLVLFGTHPSDSAGNPFTTGTDPNYWATLAGFAGQSETGDLASSFVMCATANGTAHTTVVTASTTAANATQESSAPTLTTATCPQGDQLLSGGALEDTPGQVNDGSTTVNGGNLKPVASYPSNSSGAMVSNGSTSADSWSTYGSAGGPTSSDKVIAFAVCSTDSSPPAVEVARRDDAGPTGQTGSTVTSETVQCPGGARLLGGGYAIDETVGSTGGLQPQQGYHVRGSYPSDASGTEVSNNTNDPSYWTVVQQAGGQTLGATKHMDTHTFAMCSH